MNNVDEVSNTNKNDENAFEVVNYQKRKTRKAQEISPVRKKKIGCVSRIHPKTKEDDVLEYLQENCSTETIFTCEK